MNARGKLCVQKAKASLQTSSTYRFRGGVQFPTIALESRHVPSTLKVYFPADFHPVRKLIDILLKTPLFYLQ